MRDLRKYSQQTNMRLALGAFALLFAVGGGLIYLFYGSQAAVTGIICLALGLAPLLLIWLALAAVEWVKRRADQ